jgi:hypothetical protein
MSNQEEFEVDSELAALLDEELFSEGDAAAAEVQAPHEAAADEPEQQQHKRPRWSSLEPEHIELDDEDKEFLETCGFDQDSSEGDDNAEQQGNPRGQQQDADAAGYVCPPHPGWWMNMCIRCGAMRPEADPSQQGAAAASKATLTKIKHLHHKQALEVGVLLFLCSLQPLSCVTGPPLALALGGVARAQLRKSVVDVLATRTSHLRSTGPALLLTQHSAADNWLCNSSNNYSMLIVEMRFTEEFMQSLSIHGCPFMLVHHCCCCCCCCCCCRWLPTRLRA